MGAILPNSYAQGFLAAVLYQGSLKSVCSPLLNCYACPSALFSCPIGTLQHFMVTGSFPYYGAGTLAAIGATVGRMTFWTRHIRYVVLIGLVFAIPYITHENWFSKLCPMGTLIGGLPWVTLNLNVRSMIRALFWVKIAILLFFLTASTMVKRPF